MGHFGLKVFLFSVLGVGCNKARLNLAAHQSYAASASALAPAVVKGTVTACYLFISLTKYIKKTTFRVVFAVGVTDEITTVCFISN